MSEWNNTSERLPVYGEALILKINGVNQNITYQFDGADNGDDPFYWFEPYHFDHASDETIKLKPDILWKYVSEV